MNSKTHTLFIIFILLFLRPSMAQEHVSFYPFKGFHVGITGQAEFIQKPTYVALIGTDPAPKARWSYGWEMGIEFSYHFAQFFGVSVGINYGTAISYERAFNISNFPIPYLMRGKINKGHSSVDGWQEIEILFPVKLEFHYPLRKDLFFTAEAGVKVKGIYERLWYGKNAKGIHGSGYSYYDPEDSDPETGVHYSTTYYDDWGVYDAGKISCNLLLGIGLYYKLPYGDLLRFTAGVNISFNNIIEGHYQYYLTDSYGSFAVKNDFIYTQLSYIHTLNWQKAKKYLKKQELSFSSKKERRQKIMKLLKI